MKNNVVTVGHRWGGQTSVSVDELDPVLSRLVEELLEEPHDFPDDEHTQIYLRRADGASLTAYVEGLLCYERSAAKLCSSVQTVDEMEEVFRGFAAGELSPSEDDGWGDSSDHKEKLPGLEFRPYPHEPLPEEFYEGARRAVYVHLAEEVLWCQVEELDEETKLLDDPEDQEEIETLVASLEELAEDLEFLDLMGLHFVTERVPLVRLESVRTVEGAVKRFVRGLETLAARAKPREESAPPTVPTPPIEGVLTRVREWISELMSLPVEDVSPEMRLVGDLGMGRFDLEDFLMGLSEVFDCETDFVKLAGGENLDQPDSIGGLTVAQFAEWLQPRLGADGVG